MPRAAAALVAMICWTAIGVRIDATYAQTGDIFAALWFLVRYFTFLTNVAVAVVMTGVVFGRRFSDFLLGGLMLSILLVGVVYLVLLQHLERLTGLALFADTLLHKVSPIAMTAYWLAFAPHGRLGWKAPLWWSSFPLTYFAYALVRGAIDGRYPYPFMDVTRIGAGETALNAVVIAVAFILAGEGLVWLDRQALGRAKLVSKAPA